MGKIDAIFDLQNEEIARKSHLKQKKESPRTSNGFYQNFLRLDLLTRTPSRRISAQLLE
jgi:hypothetical protein